MAPHSASLVCERARAQVSAGLDEDLSQLGRAMVESHLERCPACAEYAAGVTAFTEALRAAPPESPTRAVTVRPSRRPVRARIQSRAQIAAAAAAVAVGILAGTKLASSDSLQLEPSVVPVGGSQVVPQTPSQKQLEIEQALLERAEPGKPVDLAGRVL